MSVFARDWEAVAGGFPASAVSRETSDPACLSGKVGFTWNGTVTAHGVAARRPTYQERSGTNVNRPSSSLGS
jgi:hypothetical protein